MKTYAIVVTIPDDTEGAELTDAIIEDGAWYLLPQAKPGECSDPVEEDGSHSFRPNLCEGCLQYL